MNYTREYLQGLAQENKKNEVSLMISLFIDDLKKIAGSGGKQYLVDFSNVRFDPYATQTLPNQIGVAPRSLQAVLYFKSLDEMIPFFHERFPGCTIYVHEEWVDVTPTSRCLKRGILIDWTA
jgi:hypothetical protein